MLAIHSMASLLLQGLTPAASAMKGANRCSTLGIQHQTHQNKNFEVAGRCSHRMGDRGLHGGSYNKYEQQTLQHLCFRECITEKMMLRKLRKCEVGMDYTYLL